MTNDHANPPPPETTPPSSVALADEPLAKRDIRRRGSLVAQTALRLLGRKGAIVGAAWIGFTAFLAVWAPLLANSRPLAWQVQADNGQWNWRFPAFEMLTPQDVMFIAAFVLGVLALCCWKAGGKVFWVWLSAMCAVFAASMFYVLAEQQGELADAIASNKKIFASEQSEANRKAIFDSQLALAWWWLRWVLIGLGTLMLVVLCFFNLRRDQLWLVINGGLTAVLFVALMLPPLNVKPVPNDAPGYAYYRLQLAQGLAKDAWFALIPYSPNDDLPEQTTIKPDTLQVGVRNVLRPPGQHPRIPDIAQEMQIQAETLYGLRVRDLIDEQGDPVPLPATIAEAYTAADALDVAYQQSPTYNPDRAPLIRQGVADLFGAFETIPTRSRMHWLGTTYNGQDLAARMIHGARIALYIGFISTGIAVVLGIIIGGLLGYFAGWVDLIGLRLVEIFSAIPVIMLLIMIVAFYGRSLILMMVVLGLTGWVGYAYFVRAEFLKLRKMDYVMAARAVGTPLHLILFKHMLPNGVAPVLVGASFGIAGAIMTEATLSFLGLGLEPTESSWGQMLDQARRGGSFSWWLAIYPGSAIFLTVFAYNLIGEALRDVIDPRAAK